MKKGVFYKTIATGVATAMFIPLVAFALEIRAADQPSTASSETIENDLYLAGGNITSAATITGDLVTAGGNILISGPVSADLSVAGGNITITSDVGDDLRAGGGTVVFQGSVAGDVVIGGGQITIGGEGVGGDVLIGGGMVSISAPVGGSMRIAGGEVVINAPVRGDVQIKAEKVTLGPNAVLEGNLTYTAREMAKMDESAVVKGETNFTERKTPGKVVTAAGLATLFTLWTLGKLLMMIVGAFALYLFFPRYARELVANTTAHALPSIGVGVVFAIVTPVVSLVLLATLIGIPLGALGFIAYVGGLLFASIAAPIVTGSIVFHWISKRGYIVAWQTILLGVVVYFLLGLIPVVGWIAKLVLFLLTLGAALSIKWSIAKAWR